MTALPPLTAHRWLLDIPPACTDRNLDGTPCDLPTGHYPPEHEHWPALPLPGRRPIRWGRRAPDREPAPRPPCQCSAHRIARRYSGRANQ